MKTLRGRLFVAVGLAVVVSVTLTLVVGAALVRRSVERSVLANIGRQADLLAARQQGGGLTQTQTAQLQRLLAGRGERLFVFASSPPQLAGLPPSARAALAAGRSVQGKAVVRGASVLYAASPAGNQIVLLVRPASLGTSEFGPFLWALVIAGLVGTGVAFVVSFVVARAITRPIRRVAEASRGLTAGGQPMPVPVEGSDEIAVLSSSFNEMTGQLARAREGEQTFLLSVSHELKTPLTAIRGYAEGLEEGVVAGSEAGRMIGEESARLERLVQDLLDLARVSRRTFTVRREAIDMAEIARDAVRRHEARARGFGVGLGAPASGQVPAVGDPDRVLQVVSNLAENAIRCTPPEGRVTVTAAEGSVTVSDTGPGLSPDDVSHAFERFFLYRRYGAERPVGAGLGLAVVKELTEAMGGNVGVASELGRGSAFTVRLPAPPAQASELAPL